MPEIQMTTSARYWNLHTDELIRAAEDEIYSGDDNYAVQTFRLYDVNGAEMVRLEVLSPGQIVASAPKGTTLVHTAAGWEVLTDEQAAARNIPTPTPEP